MSSDSSLRPRAIPGQARDDAPVEFPSPRRPLRRNEWTRAKMVAFLRELAACRSVSDAAKSVGMSRQSAYKLRTRLAGTPFALAWKAALAAPQRAISGRGVSPARQAAFSWLAR